MRKNFLISTLLGISLLLSSVSGIPQAEAVATASASSRQAASSPLTTTVPDADPLPPEQNDPGFERLSGAYEPAAEENISADTATDTAKTDSSSGVLSINPAGSRLKQVSSSVSNYTRKTYTHASDFDGMNIYNGIDVSYHQGDIDWAAVKADGIDFAILRLGYRGYSNGSLVTDSKFTSYIRDAISVGMPLGVYFWTEAINVDEAVQEAQYVISKLAPYQSSITMPVVIDWELNNNSRHDGLSKETNTNG